MKERRVTCLALGVAFLFVAGLVFPLMGGEPQPDIQLEEEIWDFGRISEGEKVTHFFIFTNVGEGDLFISKVRSSCGCLAATASEEKISSHQDGAIKATFDSYRRQGEQKKSIWVHSNDPDEPTVKLEVTGVVEASVFLRPERLAFKDCSKGESVTESLRILPAKEELRTVRVESTWEYLSAKVSEIGEGEDEFDVLVTLSPEAPSGEFRKELKIYINDEESARKSVPIYVRVKGEVAVVPEHLSFRTIEPGRSLSRKLRVTKEGGDLKILKVESGLPWVSTKVRTIERGREYEIVVELRPKERIRERSAEIRIFTNHPDQPMIEIPLLFYRLR